MKRGYIVIIVLVIGIALGAYVFFSRSLQNNDSSIDETLDAEASLLTLEEILGQGMMLKAEGDAILEGKSIVEMSFLFAVPIANATGHAGGRFEDLADQAKHQWTLIKGIKVAVPLAGFHSSLEQWIEEIWQAAEKIKLTGSEEEWAAIWEPLTDNPPPFTTNLSDEEILRILKTKIDIIVTLKEQGDVAVEKGDRQVMNTIAAQLRVQNYWLKYHLLDRGSVCPQVGVCYEQITQTLPEVAEAAIDFAYGEQVPVETWSKVWEPAELVIGGGGAIVTGAGLSVGPPDVYEFSPTTKAFFENCTSKGGIVGGTGGVKSGLPTTESGYTCWHDDRKQCWDFLTYSGGEYAGGPGNCPKKDVTIPVPTQDSAVEGEPVDSETGQDPGSDEMGEEPTSEPTTTTTPPPSPPPSGPVTGRGSFTGGYAGPLTLTLTPTGGALSGSMNGSLGTVGIAGSVSSSGGITARLSGTLAEVIAEDTYSCFVSGSLSGAVSGNSAGGSYSGACGVDSASGGWSVSW